MQLTLIVNQGEDNFLVGQLKEIPEVISQGWCGAANGLNEIGLL